MAQVGTTGTMQRGHAPIKPSYRTIVLIRLSRASRGLLRWRAAKLRSVRRSRT